MTANETIDARCTDCVALGVECLEGYEVAKLRCSICGHRFVLMRTGCSLPATECPECALREMSYDD